MLRDGGRAGQTRKPRVFPGAASPPQRVARGLAPSTRALAARTRGYSPRSTLTRRRHPAASAPGRAESGAYGPIGGRPVPPPSLIGQFPRPSADRLAGCGRRFRRGRRSPAALASVSAPVRHAPAAPNGSASSGADGFRGSQWRHGVRTDAPDSLSAAGCRRGARPPAEAPDQARRRDQCGAGGGDCLRLGRSGKWVTAGPAERGRRLQILPAMARRPRSSRAWRFVLSAARRDADARSAAGAASWGCDSDGQHSDPDSEPECTALPPAIPSAVPVTGESFCGCEGQSEATFCSGLHGAHRGKDCRCGEEDEHFDWVWDAGNKSSATRLSCDDRKVSFHVEYSCGTAAVRGTKELGDGQHFWEIKMTSPVYGTDMMVGIGTSAVDLDQYQHTFCSLLGRDADSWGLSYTGLLHHKGDKTSFSSRFGQGSIIGVHLDTWHGTLTFFKNRKCIGVAATKLQNRKFYPMVCSTAAKSSMKVIRACASATSLQYLCCYRLRQLRPSSRDTLEGLPLPPGLKQLLHHKLGWVLSMSCSRHLSPASAPSKAPSSSPEPRRCQRKRCRRTEQ
ncbi:SPRY domain-containing SOCS box protein 3 isoform X2 [Sorex araneus]|uniref:SPRY domain-containing SOCS box protein 3 isoform X2 n=1 Tax=Sorex araneus TaxID=42254 RepID=UPI002433BF26|nr:SPRY domain-containing SOCS box protein 3 isoform X2 [Sorex araneus]